MRTLHWDGCPNIRDLGGLPTSASASGYTQLGRIARGPRRELLSVTGWEQARRWGLRHVVDLRCAQEVGRREQDPQVPATAWAGVSIELAPTEDQENPEFRAACFPILDSPEYWAHNWRILPDMVRQALESIAAAGPGTLFHCAAGRDRTGMISALLLGNAGVAPELVAEDYADSVRIMAGTAHHGPTADRQAAWAHNETEAWLDDKRPIVAEAAARAPQILAELGCSTATRDALRQLLTTA